MRIWDQIPANYLCRNHLLAQWREGLGLWSILVNNKTGYANHPETKRWRGHENALYSVLSQTREAMLKRNYKPKELPTPPMQFENNIVFPLPWDNQLISLAVKECMCQVENVIPINR